MKQTKFTTRDMTQMALFTALTAVTSQIIIPLPFTPVRINLATLAVFLAGGLLGPVKGAASLGLYALLGMAGVPVFAGLKGGIGIVTGPTGGFIVGYIVAAFVIGILKSKVPKSVWTYGFCITAGAFCCFSLGVAWFMIVTGNGLGSALTMCVIPFLPGDFMKIALAAVLVERLETVLRVAGQVK